MKIGDILTEIKKEGETPATVAKRINGISEKKLRQALKDAGYTFSNVKPKGWHYTGSAEEPLNESIFSYIKAKATAKERSNLTTKERKYVRMNEEIKEPTKERTHRMRKRASFDLDTELLKELKIFAIQEEKNVYEIVEQAIRDHLKAQK